jgi:Flp pilus assembly protein TadG
LNEVKIMTRFPRVRGISGEKGATLLEFAFVSILFMMLTAGMMELARGVWIYNSVSHAAREGCRYAIVNGGESGHIKTDTQISDYVKTRIPFDVEVTTTWTDVAKTPGTVVTVTVDFDFEPVIAFFPAVPLTSTSQMVISY